MAVYKVLQDVEAEDKLVGPLTLKGFVYALIALACAYINFRLLMIGTPIKWVFILMFLMPMLLFGVLASPLGREQPTEVWLLSKIKFFFKPRKRTWDQAGIEQLVTITVPKIIQQHLTKDFSQTEVHSRLKTLASTLDTRGWAIKNIDVNLNALPVQGPTTINPASDRLVSGAGYAQPAQVIDVRADDDILDEQNNPTAQKFASMMQTADDQRRRNILQTMKGVMDDSQDTPADKIQTDLAQARESFVKLHGKTSKKADSHHKVLSTQTPTTNSAPKPQPTPVTPERQAVNMELAQSGSAFSVATLSQLANRKSQIEQTGPGEVTISLH